LGFNPNEFFRDINNGSISALQMFSIVSAIFLHKSGAHLFINLYFLFIFGPVIEQKLGGCKYLFYFIFCGILGFLGQAYFAGIAGTNQIDIGASGSISGLLGGVLFTYPRAKILTFVPLVIVFYVVEFPAFIYLLFFVLIQIYNVFFLLLKEGFGFLHYGHGGVAWWSHLIGFITGGVIIPFLKKMPSD